MKTASQAQLTLLRKLKQRKYRTIEQKFVIEGERAIDQVIENGVVDVEAIFVKASKLDHFKGVNEKLHLLDHRDFNELSDTDNPQGMLAICKIPEPISLSQLSTTNGLIIATDAIQDPGNMGTIIRSAVWYGASALITGTGSVDIYNPKVVRSTAGATGILPFVQGELVDLCSELKTLGWSVMLLDGNAGAVSISDVPFQNKTILIVGNEANGVSSELIDAGYQRVLLPTKSPQQYVESLNAGVALSIALAIVNN
ncbi:MAG: RNA methyltransferase [bacterium]|nr:RNA methyltransferase [bacterium]